MSRKFQWRYNTGSLTGAGTLGITGRGISIDVFANGADSSFTITGVGLTSTDTITLRAGRSMTINLSEDKAEIRDPVVTWVSGSLDIVIAFVT